MGTTGDGGRICIVQQQGIWKEDDICRIIYADTWMMDILVVTRTLELPDSWVCAGFIRSKVWDTLHGYGHRTPLPDVDVIYYDSLDVHETTEKELEGQLRERCPGVPWSVKNQARMHRINDQDPYISSSDAIANFPETATAVGVRLQNDYRMELVAPWGVSDLVSLVVRPTPPFALLNSPKAKIYENRVAKKGWRQTWPLVHIVYPS